MGYHKIHCPVCGGILYPIDVKFSISEFVREIEDKGLVKDYSDGIRGIIDGDQIHLITQNDFLWDMSKEDIEKCIVKDRFTLMRNGLLCRFGNRVMQMVDQGEPDEKIALEILKSLPEEILSREGNTGEARLKAVTDLIKYAKTGEVLFSINLQFNMVKDDMGNEIAMDIRTGRGDIIGKSKKCSSCGSPLSKMAGQYEEKIVSLLGTPAAGKSAYLTAAIQKMINNARVECGISVELERTSSDYIEMNELCLEPYSNGFAVTKTDQGTFPQLSLGLKNVKTGKIFLYTFVDIPGEIFIGEENNESEWLTNRKIIQHSDVIWYCVSAKQLFAEAYNRENRGELDNSEMVELQTLNQNTMEFVKAMFRNRPKPAVALILTKSDLLESLIATTRFDMDSDTDVELKQYYYKIITSAINGGSWDICDGEPISLQAMDDFRLKYERIMNNAQKVSEFIKNYGVDYARIFLEDMSDAFEKTQLPCFSQAAYGREPVISFSIKAILENLFSQDKILEEKDLAYVKSLCGEENYLNKNYVVLREQRKDDSYYVELRKLYKKYNSIKPFGIMMILNWTFAYTGILPCIAADGEDWKEIPMYGNEFEELQDTLANNKQKRVTVQQPTSNKSKKNGFFAKFF